MSREPEDGTPENTGPSGAPDDTFDRIVASWRDEGSVPSWPDAPPPGADAPSGHPATPAATPQPPVHRPGPEQPVDDDHFHPPEPPPLPRPGPPALVGAVLIGIGLLLIAVPATLGMSSLYGLPLGLVAVAAGLTWLVMRMWPSDDDDHYTDGGDDGAVL